MIPFLLRSAMRIFLPVCSAFAHEGVSSGQWHHMMPFCPGGIPLILLVVIVAVILLLLFVGRTSERGRDKGEEGPLDILRRRYAAGEIDREEFERMRKDIER